jgi:hypothetical protein
MKHDMRATGNRKSSWLEYLKFQSLQNDGKRAIHNWGGFDPGVEI